MEEILQQFYEKKQVLVTGGAGFIGSHLVEKLVALGARVTVLDNFSSGNLTNLKAVVSAINLLYADIRSPYSCLKATTQQEVVFHLAAFVSVPESIVYPDVCKLVNTQGTYHLLDAAAKNGVKRLVLSSSSAVYGDANGTCSEDDLPTPMSPYAESKFEAEQLCKEFSEKTDLATTCLRYFNVFGDRQNPHGSYAAVVAKFTHLLQAGQPITIFGDGQQTRDFINVSKAVEANLLVGMGQATGNAVFNIGSGQSISLLTLLGQLEDRLSIKNKGISFLPARQGDILHSQAQCQKFTSFVQNLIGQEAKTC